MAETSTSKIACRLPTDLHPCARVGPDPVSSLVTIHPIPAERRKDPSVQACITSPSVGDFQKEYWRALGWNRSISRPSLMSRPSPEAPLNHGEVRFRDELSLTGGGTRLRWGGSRGAARAEHRRRSRLRSKAGPVGRMSAARIASSHFVVLNVPATHDWHYT